MELRLHTVTTAAEETSLNIARISLNLRSLSSTSFSNPGLKELRIEVLTGRQRCSIAFAEF
jgi:hypothetical protein